MPASKNAIRMIMPYFAAGTWVFDDERVGLVREPFVAGVPEIINRLVAGIPNARDGFRMLFSEGPFPGYQASFTKTREEHAGIWYRDDQSGAEGWLCPALFKYYAKAPHQLFVRCEKIG